MIDSYATCKAIAYSISQFGSREELTQRWVDWASRLSHAHQLDMQSHQMQDIPIFIRPEGDQGATAFLISAESNLVVLSIDGNPQRADVVILTIPTIPVEKGYATLTFMGLIMNRHIDSGYRFDELVNEISETDKYTVNNYGTIMGG